VVAQEERVADRNGDGVVSESEARAARDRVQTRLANREQAEARADGDRSPGDREAEARPESRTWGRTMFLGGRKQPLTEREVDRAEAERTERLRAADPSDLQDRNDLHAEANRATANRLLAERAAAEAAEDRAADRVVGKEPVTRPIAPVAPEPETRPEPKIRARTSMFATFALIFGLSSVYAALSGRLAPAALVLGLVGLVFSFAGLTATGRPRVTGSTMALLALILSVGGPVLAILAMNHSATWLDSDVDQVARLRDWLDAQLPFIKSW